MQSRVPSITTVDLFAGCGGLSLGFELYQGSVTYDTVLAVDNDRSVIRCFNDNRPRPKSAFPTGRLADLTWFHHPSEVLLYYLAHVAFWRPDEQLQEALEHELGFGAFLARLKQLDEDFLSRLSTAQREQGYRDCLKDVSSSTFTMATVKSFLSRIDLKSLRAASFTATGLPWQQEYESLDLSAIAAPSSVEERVITELADNAASLWKREVDRLASAAQRRGRGQHKIVNARLQRLVDFLTSSSATALENAWVEWRARRDSLRASYCLEVEQRLQLLYNEGRRVNLVLGGPPCKGFSRIGRAVIEDLRDQGAHAWSSHDYGDERNALMHRYVLVLQALQPEAFLFENVAHFQSSLRTPSGRLDAAEVLEDAIQELSNGGAVYDVRSSLVNARHFAVPQDRERFIMVGFNALATDSATAAERFFDLPTFEQEVDLQTALVGLPPPAEFAWNDSSSTVTTRHECPTYSFTDPKLPPSLLSYSEWIQQPDLATGEQGTTDAHIVRRLRSDDLALIRKFAPGQRWMDYKIEAGGPTLRMLREVLAKILKAAERDGNGGTLPSTATIESLLDRIDSGLALRLLMEDADARSGRHEPNHLLENGYLRKGTDNHGDWFERLSPVRPCKTIVAHIGKDTYGYIHPYENRALSMREAARVQSFPDFFRFGSAGVVDGYAMIGNAVPPLLANVFAERFAILHTGDVLSPRSGVSHSRQHSRAKQLAIDVALGA